MDLDHSNRSVKMDVEEDRARIPLHYIVETIFLARGNLRFYGIRRVGDFFRG